MVSITKWLIYGLIGAFAVTSLIDPQRAYASTQAFGGVGGALGSLGTGVQSLFTGIGTGTAKLFNPLFTLRDLIFGPQAGVQTPTDIRQSSSTHNLTIQQEPYQIRAIQLDPGAPFTPVTSGFGSIPTLGEPPNYSERTAEQGAAIAADHTLQGFSYSMRPGFGGVPVTQAVVHGVSLPLSAEAVRYYNQIGVTVTPEAADTVAAQNAENATSATNAATSGSSGQSASYSAGAAQAAGYSTGSPTVS